MDFKTIEENRALYRRGIRLLAEMIIRNDVLSVLRNKPHEYNPDRESGYKVQREES